MSLKEVNFPRTHKALHNLEKLFTPFLFLAPIVYIFTSLATITSPGVNFDEVMWINTSINTGDKTFVRDAIGQFPTMLMDYIGALKGYVYKPVFAIFGTNFYSLRVPTILIVGVGISILAHVVRKLLGPAVGLALVVALMSNPALALQAKFDLGPSALEFFFRCVLLGYLGFLMLGNGRDKFLLLFTILFLGLWNKLSFIWCVNSLIAGIFVLWVVSRPKSRTWKEHFRTVKNFARDKPRTILAVVASYLFFLFMYARYVGSGANSSTNFSFETKINFISGTISGTSFYNWFWQPVAHPLGALSIQITVLGVILAAVMFAISMSRFHNGTVDRTTSKLEKFNIIVIVALCTQVLQILFTREADKPWHALTVLPLVYLVALLGLLQISTISSNKTVKISLFIANTIFIIALVASQVMGRTLVDANIVNVQRETSSWSRIANASGTEELFDWLANRPEKKFFLDWGFQTVALFHNPDKASTHADLTSNFLADEEGATKTAEVELENGNIFVTHSSMASAFPQVRDTFLSNIRKSKIQLCQIKTFFDGEEPFVEIWQKCN